MSAARCAVTAGGDPRGDPQRPAIALHMHQPLIPPGALPRECDPGPCSRAQGGRGCFYSGSTKLERAEPREWSVDEEDLHRDVGLDVGATSSTRPAPSTQPPGALTVELNIRTYHPVLIAAGLADQATPIPWLNGRELRLRFPPR